MTSSDFQKKLIAYLEKKFGAQSTRTPSSLPPQGMSSSVFFITLPDEGECAVKYGRDAMKDVPALKLIADKHIDIPVPELMASFIFEDVPVIILKKILFPLLETIPVEELPLYVPSMVSNLNKLHTITSPKPGLLTVRGSKNTWKDMMLSMFDGSDVDWGEIAARPCFDNELILRSVEGIKKMIENTVFALHTYSLLHTDFNQRNLFVDPSTHEIAGVIDWEDAVFGDPLYDFARVRMYLWHYDFAQQVIEDYYALVNFTPEQKKLEELYWLSRIIQYLAWYSEELNEFTISRTQLHQEYLKNYTW